MRKFNFIVVVFVFLQISMKGQLNCSGGGAPSIVTFNLAGLESIDELWDIDNVILTQTAAFPGDIVGIEYSNVDISILGASYCSEPTISIQDEEQSSASYFDIYFSEGENDNPCVDLPANGFIDVDTEIITGDGFIRYTSGSPNPTGSGGEIVIELYEDFDDDPDAADALFNSGLVSVYVCPVGQVLPIKLKKIHAEEYGKVNRIIWETITEINNSHQIIEKSKDGDYNWTEVGRVNGTNTVSDKSYEVIDTKPSTITYYRLRSVDFDGQEELSNIITVKRKDVGISQIKFLYQDKGNDNLLINYNSSLEGDVEFTIFDNGSKLIKNQKFNTSKGENEIIIDISEMTSGIYYIKSENQTNSEVKKFVKL